jgi:uncharacterized membrane protein YphA (DoxX/SURF4 family)
MIGARLAMLFEEPEIDVSAHLPLVSWLILIAVGLLIAFFMVRPELWRRLMFQRVDPRPAALLRISFGAVVMVTFVDLLGPHGPLEYSVARFLFTDDGMWLNDMARKTYGGKLATLWDPEHGFEQWYDVLKAMWGKFSILHFRSDPPFVWAVYTMMLVSIGLMILGVWTRWTTILAWFLVESVHRYSPVFYTGGDTVVRVFMFLGMFVRWGEAYSVDGWRRRRKAILRGATEIPPPRLIPAWPLRLMMLQLAIIYCATGLLKSGNTWANGTALYYSLNLDHFYRFPVMGVVGPMHYIGVLPLLTILVHWWEILFPLGLIGAAVNAWERERKDGTWPKAAQWRRWLSYALFFGAWGIGAYVAGIAARYYTPPELLATLRVNLPTMVALATAVTAAVPLLCLAFYLALRAKLPRVHAFIRHWLLGKRFWLVVGIGMHIGIDLGMNVGTFANVMMAVYFAWLSGDEIDAFWRYCYSVPQRPGEGDRPLRQPTWKKPWARAIQRLWLRAVIVPLDRLRFRKPGPPVVVLHHPGEPSVRRGALLRLWDLGHTLEFQADSDVSPEHLLLRMPGDKTTRAGTRAGWSLIRVLPGLWWMRGLRHIPGLSAVCGLLALKILRQR